MPVQGCTLPFNSNISCNVYSSLCFYMYELFRPSVHKNRTVMPKTVACSCVHELKQTIALTIVLQCSFHHCIFEVLQYRSCFLFRVFQFVLSFSGMFYSIITVMQTSLYQVRNWNATFLNVLCMRCCGVLPVTPS